MATATRVHAFLAGRGVDGRGRRLAEVLAFDDDALERHHDYIQWLFPLPTASVAVPGSPILSAEEIEIVREDAVATAALRAAADTMRRFYETNDHWLVAHDHNHLRISRIVASLTLLLGRPEAARFLAAVERRVRLFGDPVNAETRRRWRDALG